jgi:hypothetical protein
LIQRAAYGVGRQQGRGSARGAAGWHAEPRETQQRAAARGVHTCGVVCGFVVPELRLRDHDLLAAAAPHAAAGRWRRTGAGRALLPLERGSMPACTAQAVRAQGLSLVAAAAARASALDWRWRGQGRQGVRGCCSAAGCALLVWSVLCWAWVSYPCCWMQGRGSQALLALHAAAAAWGCCRCCCCRRCCSRLLRAACRSCE